MASALNSATYRVTLDSLQYMALQRGQLPPELRSFGVMREGPLDNAAMAQHGFFGNTPESLLRLGRIGGYLREFGNPIPKPEVQDGTDLAAAVVLHLFKSDADVSRWIDRVFVREFLDNAGQPVTPGQELVSADRFTIQGLAYDAAGIHAVQRAQIGLVSSTVADFRVGRLLGVAYVVTMGEQPRTSIVQAMARTLEQQMVRVVLGSV